MSTCRILHFSDVHLVYPPGAWRHPHVLHPKRLIACLNYIIRRRKNYTQGDDRLRALHAFLDQHPVDYIFYTGDSTNAGLESELFEAAPVLRNLLGRAKEGFLAVPGNHDLYTPASCAHYARHWAFAAKSDLPATQTATGLPILRLMGEDAAAIGLGSARPRFPFWDSSGEIPPEELAALDALLDLPEIKARRHLFLLMHYPPADADRFHGLKNHAGLLSILAKRPDLIVLHGHHHTRSTYLFGETHQRAYCAGSLTSRRKEGFWLFEMEGAILNATPYAYTAAAFYPTS